MPLRVDILSIYYWVLTEAEVEAAAHWLKLHKAGGHTQRWPEHLKGWLQEAYSDSETSPPPPTLPTGRNCHSDAAHVGEKHSPNRAELDYLGIYPQRKYVHPGDRITRVPVKDIVVCH